MTLPATSRPGNIGLARRRRIDAFALQAIGTVDARRGNLDQNLAWPRFRHRRLADPDDIRAAMAVEINLPHHAHDICRTASLSRNTHAGQAGFMKK